MGHSFVPYCPPPPIASPSVQLAEATEVASRQRLHFPQDIILLGVWLAEKRLSACQRALDKSFDNICAFQSCCTLGCYYYYFATALRISFGNFCIWPKVSNCAQTAAPISMKESALKKNVAKNLKVFLLQ